MGCERCRSPQSLLRPWLPFAIAGSPSRTRMRCSRPSQWPTRPPWPPVTISAIPEPSATRSMPAERCRFPTGPPTVTPFLENDRVLASVDDLFNGDYLDEETLLAAARAAGYGTA